MSEETQEQKEAREKKEAEDKAAADKKAAEEKAEADRKAKEEKDTKERLASLEFDNKFKEVESKYPHAKDFKDKIRERVNAGMPVDEATIVVLGKEEKLQTREQIETAHAAEGSMGGSANFIPPPGQKKPEEMTQEELRKALVEEEKKGTFRYDPD